LSIILDVPLVINPKASLGALYKPEFALKNLIDALVEVPSAA
jgi:hypothetical protein